MHLTAMRVAGFAEYQSLLDQLISAARQQGVQRVDFIDYDLEPAVPGYPLMQCPSMTEPEICLLYTSDAADE